MRLGEVMKSHREKQRLGVRGMAKIVGLSPMTISRIERGKPIDLATFIRLWSWLIAD